MKNIQGLGQTQIPQSKKWQPQNPIDLRNGQTPEKEKEGENLRTPLAHALPAFSSKMPSMDGHGESGDMLSGRVFFRHHPCQCFLKAEGVSMVSSDEDGETLATQWGGGLGRG